MVASTGGRIARGAAWMVGARLADRAIGLVGTLVLARLLTPADFGLVAMAIAVIALIELAAAFGFEVSLVRKTNPTREHYDTVWTLNLLFALGCGAATALAAFPAARFYADERLVPILLVLGASWVLSGLTNVGVVDFQRTLNFSMEFRYLISRRVVGFVVTIVLAVLTRSYWALIAGTIALRMTGLLLSYLWHPYRPRLGLRATGEIFSFSAWIFVEKIAMFGTMRAADFVLGRTHGAAEVGFYRIGEEIGHLPGTELVAPLNRVLLPGMSQLFESGRPTGEVVVTATGVVGLVLIPASLGISAIADPLVRVMLGNQWLPAIPIVQLMALNSLFRALWANQNTTLLAYGNSRVPALIAVARFAVFAPCVFLLVDQGGATGVAKSAVLSSVVALLLGLGASLPMLGVSLAAYLRVLWRPVLAGLVMWATVGRLLEVWHANDRLMFDAGRLLVAVSSGCLIYVWAMVLLYLIAGKPMGTERLLLDRIRVWRGKHADLNAPSG